MFIGKSMPCTSQFYFGPVAYWLHFGTSEGDLVQDSARVDLSDHDRNTEGGHWIHSIKKNARLQGRDILDSLNSSMKYWSGSQARGEGRELVN